MSAVGNLFESRSTTRSRRLPPTFGTIQTGGGGRISVSPGVRPGQVFAGGSPNFDFRGRGNVFLDRFRGGLPSSPRDNFDSNRNPIIDVSLPESIAQLREEALSGTRGLRDDVTRDIDTLRGLENPFIQARVRPFEEARDERLAGLTRDVRRRGGFNAATERFITGTGEQLERGIADQRVLATQEAQTAIRGAQQFAAALDERIGTIGQQELAQVLAELGLGQQALQQFLASQQVASQTTRGRPSAAEIGGNVITGLATGGFFN